MAKPAVGGSPAIRVLRPARVWSITGAPPQRRLCATMWCWGLFVGPGLRGSALGLVIPAAEGEGIAVLDALPARFARSLPPLKSLALNADGIARPRPGATGRW